MSGEGTTASSSQAEQWVRRIASGDPVAEIEFANHFSAKVRTLVRRQMRPLSPDVDDLTQDVLQLTLVSLREGRLRDASTLAAYLHGVVVMMVRAYYRKQHRRGEDRVADIDENMPDGGDGPERRVETTQLARLLRQTIDELPQERDRQLLIRFYLKEEDKDPVCAALGIDDDHFHRVVFRARVRLRELLLASANRGQ